MSKLDKAFDIDLAERAEQLSKEAEQLRSDDRPAVSETVDGTIEFDRVEFDRAVAASVQKLRKLAKR